MTLTNSKGIISAKVQLFPKNKETRKSIKISQNRDVYKTEEMNPDMYEGLRNL